MFIASTSEIRVQAFVPYSQESGSSEKINQVSLPIFEQTETKADREAISLLEALKKGSDDFIDPCTLEMYKRAVGLIDQNAILKEETQDTLLLLCAKSPNKQLRELVIECLKNGADPNARDFNDVTALHYATHYTHNSLVKFLLKKGASPLCKSKAGNLPLDVIRWRAPNHSTIKLLLMHSPEMLRMTLKNGNSIWMALLELGMSIENMDELILGESDPSWLFPFLSSHLENIDDLNAINHEGKTALQCCRGCAHPIFIELFLRGAVLKNSEQEKQTILKLCGIMINRNLTGPHDLSFFRKLAELDALPQEFLPCGNHPKAFFIRFTGEYAVWGLSKESVEALEAFGRLIVAFRVEEDLSEKFFLVKQLEHALTKVDSKHQFLLDACTEEISKRCAFALKIFERLEENPPSWEMPQEYLFGFQLEDLLFLAMQKNRIGLISNILSRIIAAKEFRDPHEVKIESIDKPILHFLLDKTVIKEKSILETSAFEGGQTYQMAMRLAEAMRSSQQGEYPKETLQHCNRLEKALLLSAKWSYMRKANSTYREIAEAISNISLNHPVLIPSSIPTHAMHLAVELMPQGALRLIFYNTGGGILTNHPQWENSNRFQTFIMIENVDFEHLTHRSIWKDFFDLLARTETKDIELIYDFFRDKLGQGKPVLAASEHSEDYEQKQMRGTCSAQNLMACLRHQIMEHTPGMPIEKLNVYKMIKSPLLLELSSDDTSHVEADIKEMTEKKMMKHQATSYLAKQAEEKSSFEKSLEELTEVLSWLGDPITITAKTDTKADRFYLLKLCSKKIAEHWLRERKVVFPKLTENFQLALSLFETDLITEERLEQQLEECHNLQQYNLLAEKIVYVMTCTKFKALATKWLLMDPENLQKNETLRLVLQDPKYKKVKSEIDKLNRL